MSATYLWAVKHWASDRAKNCAPQLHAIRRDLALLREMQKRGEDVVVIPISGGASALVHEHVIGAVAKAMKGGLPQNSERGWIGLREAIAEREKKVKGIDVDPETQILIHGGAMMGNYLATQAVLGPGDECIMPYPGLSFDSQVNLAGAAPVFVPLMEEEGWKWDLERLESAITKRTKMMIINTPHNPTGHVLSRGELEELAEIAKRHNLLVLSDEVYDHWLYDGNRHITMYSLPDMEDRTILSGSFTKSWGMFNWRMGWLIGNKEFIEMATNLAFWIWHMPSIVSQVGVKAVIEGPMDWVREMRERMQRNRDFCVEELNKIDGISVVKCGGGPEMLPNVSGVERSSMKFTYDILEKGRVSACPGLPYMAEGHIRWGHGGPDIDFYRECIKRLKYACELIRKEKS